MLLAINDFAARLKEAGPDAIGFLYYSGHGIASEGENYLVPVDVEEPSTRLLRVQGVRHSEVLAILKNEAPYAAHYLILDACRNSLKGARGGKGFVPVGQQSGALVAFAAEPGKTASDVGEGSGPYAKALSTELVKPGQNDLLMFHNIRVAVMESTKGDQVPWTEDGIQRRERVLFAGQGDEAAQIWAVVKLTNDVAFIKLYIQKFGNTPYGSLARTRLEELEKKPEVFNRRIVGGELTDIKQHPWVVALEIKGVGGNGLCGGALIAPRWIMTAAHCFQVGISRPEEVRVKSGETRLTAVGNWQRAERIIFHPLYNALTGEHDIALLKLAEPSKGRFIPIADAGLTLSDRQPLEITGWGKTQLGDGPGNLQRATFPYVTNDICNDNGYSGYVKPGMMCVERPVADACYGDEGGPLVWRTADGPLLVGISSREGCAQEIRYGVFTRVSLYREWTEHMIGAN